MRYEQLPSKGYKVISGGATADRRWGNKNAEEVGVKVER
jgi:hypothetical protein